MRNKGFKCIFLIYFYFHSRSESGICMVFFHLFFLFVCLFAICSCAWWSMPNLYFDSDDALQSNATNMVMLHEIYFFSCFVRSILFFAQCALICNYCLILWINHSEQKNKKNQQQNSTMNKRKKSHTKSKDAIHRFACETIWCDRLIRHGIVFVVVVFCLVSERLMLGRRDTRSAEQCHLLMPFFRNDLNISACGHRRDFTEHQQFEMWLQSPLYT